ncbi:MAG: hypothetical protein V4850_30770 [Myxococcota bacterium]
MSTSTREPGGGIPSLGALYSETLTDLTQNIQGYLMMGLALMAVVFPVSMVGTMVGMIAMYAVMGVGIFASALGGSAIGEATGEQDLGGIVTMFGSFGSFFLAFVVLFASLACLAGAMAPVSASLYRAIAAHQRGEGTLSFGDAFSTVRQDIVPTATVMLLVTGMAIVGVLFCYVGALVPAILFGFAFSMVALHRKGAMEALKICARHAMARPSEHAIFVLAYMGTAMVAGYVPLLGHMFLIALAVRAYRKMFGDGVEPVL